MDAERRQAVNALLDEFIPAAVARRDPVLALELVTPALKAGVTRAEWLRGDLPVFPFEPEGSRFHHWTLNYSLAAPDDEKTKQIIAQQDFTPQVRGGGPGGGQ